MRKQIEIQNNIIEYNLKVSSKSRRVRLAVHADGGVTVSAPSFISSEVYEDFMRKKAKWILSKIEFFKQLSQQQVKTYTKQDYANHKQEAFEIVKKKVDGYAKRYGFAYKNIAIKNQKTRWGSCSRRGNLNFNFKIIFLSEKAQDYIIVHELCHLKEFNHSKNFWKLVEDILPDYKETRDGIKKSGLHFY